MHQIISGETLKKTKVLNLEKFKDFLPDQKNIFSKFKENCLYETNDFLKSQSLNYFNFLEEKSEYKALKSIIRQEYNVLESIYPFLGDVFLINLLGNTPIKNKYKTFKFQKKYKNRFIKSLNHKTNQEIFKTLIDNFSTEYFVKVDFKKNINKVYLKSEDDNNFDLEFEKEYYEKEENVLNYKVIIIDGVIQNVSEIHYVMHDSAENKTPYVIFCYGTSPEVKHNIIVNNKKSITRIYPICLNFNENSLNVLNDIAVLHDSEIISANKGQTITTEIKKLKAVGKKISINNNMFSFIPVCSKKQIIDHKTYLSKRIQNASANSNKDVIVNRYKRLFSKSLKIILPEELKENSDFIREFNYVFKFISNLNKKYTIVKNIQNKENLHIPLQFLKIAKNKTSSIKTIFNNVEKIILKH